MSVPVLLVTCSVLLLSLGGGVEGGWLVGWGVCTLLGSRSSGDGGWVGLVLVVMCLLGVWWRGWVCCLRIV